MAPSEKAPDSEGVAPTRTARSVLKPTPAPRDVHKDRMIMEVNLNRCGCRRGTGLRFRPALGTPPRGALQRCAVRTRSRNAKAPRRSEPAFKGFGAPPTRQDEDVDEAFDFLSSQQDDGPPGGLPGNLAGGQEEEEAMPQYKMYRSARWNPERYVGSIEATVLPGGFLRHNRLCACRRGAGRSTWSRRGR